MTDSEKDTLITKLTAEKEALTATKTAQSVELTSLKQAVADLTAQRKQDEADLLAATKVVTDLKTQLSEKEAEIAAPATVKIKGESYTLPEGDFTYDGKLVSVATLKENTKLGEELLKLGVGNLQKVRSGVPAKA